MKRKKKKQMSKTRNWIAVSAWNRTGAGSHCSKLAYRRQRLTKQKIQDYLEDEEGLEDELEDLDYDLWYDEFGGVLEKK